MNDPRPPLAGSTVLLTGASSGIGYCLAKCFAATASVLVLVARRAERLEQLAGELAALNPALEVCVLPCDITCEASLDRMFAALAARGREVDILVNCAGIAGAGLFSEQRPEDIAHIIKLDVTALVSLTRRLLPGMVRRGSGGILNFSSIAGLHAFPTVAVYTGAKHFVTGFSRSLGEEVRGQGIAVSQVCCGPVTTEIWDVSEGLSELRFPPALTMSAERCARLVFDDFARGKRLIVPGALVKLMLFMADVLPSGCLRYLQPSTWRFLRQRIEASRR